MVLPQGVAFAVIAGMRFGRQHFEKLAAEKVEEVKEAIRDQTQMEEVTRRRRSRSTANPVRGNRGPPPPEIPLELPPRVKACNRKTCRSCHAGGKLQA